MPLLTAIELSSAEKLEILQRLRPPRLWTFAIDLSDSRLSLDSNGLGDTDRRSAGADVDVARRREFAAESNRSTAREAFDAISQIRESVSSGGIKPPRPNEAHARRLQSQPAA